MKFFEYNETIGVLELVEPEILLIREFSALLEDKRNICKVDKTGK